MLLALVLAQALSPVGNPEGPIFSQPSLMWSPAFFEAFPQNGRGAGAPVPLANWLIRSEDITTGWVSDAGGGAPSIPTRTANYGTDPNGGNTADRLEVPATSASMYSRIYQGSCPPFPSTASVYVKGNGTSGTIDLAVGSTAECTPCTYNATTWTRCTATTVTTSQYFLLGNITQNCGVTRAANDVLVWGAMCNSGTTAAPYVQTTSAAALPLPTGARGEALTFTRASTAMGTITASGGLATTGIANGDLRLVPSNMPRVEYDSAGTLGLLVEAARTNYCQRSEDLSNAYWTGPYACAAGASLTSNAGNAPDGTRTADRFYMTGTTTTGRCIMYATITGGVGRLPSAYVRGCIPESDAGCAEGLVDSGDGGLLFADGGVARQWDGGVGRGVVDVGMEGTAAYNACGCAYNALSWSRCIGNTGTNSGTFTLGNDGLATACGSATRGPQDVMFWGMSAENTGSTYATSYIPTVAAAAARAAELADMPISPTLTSGFSVAATATVPFPAAPFGARVHGVPGDRLPGVATGSASCADSYFGATWIAETSAASPVSNSYAAAIWATGARWATYATTSKLAGCKNGTCDTEDAITYTPPTWTRFRFGTYDATNGYIDGIISRVCFDPDPTRCR